MLNICKHCGKRIRLFEYDITGPRVRSIGQTTGGFLREVAENESALAYSLQDAVSLYILHRIATQENSMALKALEEMIHDVKGWICFSTLRKAGLLDIVGLQIRVTDRGLRELNMVDQFCGLSNHDHV